MDSSATSWLAEKGLENPNLKDDEFDFMEFMSEEFVAHMGEGLESYLSPKNNVESCTNYSISFSSLCPSSTPVVLNFNSPQNTNYGHEAESRSQRTARIRPPSQTYDHIVAERRRREQLSQHFLALSTIVPGLKKMDKTSILGDAITHLKYLQERVKSLEEESRKKSIECQCVVLVNKSEHPIPNQNGITLLPQIEAKVCHAQILIRIDCEYRKSLLAKLIAQLEKLNLTILTTHATRFGMLILEITIITKMEKEFNSSVNQVLESLHAAIKHDL